MFFQSEQFFFWGFNQPVFIKLIIRFQNDKKILLNHGKVFSLVIESSISSFQLFGTLDTYFE